MTITLGTPDLAGMPAIYAALREWQSDDAAFQLHPGDIAWFERFGPAKAAESLRTWTRNGGIVAIGFLDGADLLRLTIAPDAAHDDTLASEIATDLNDPIRGVLPADEVYLELPNDVRLRQTLAAAGWRTDAPWTPLRRELAHPVEPVNLRIETVDSALALERVALQRSAFATSTFTVEAWTAMTTSPGFEGARDLLAFDEDNTAVAAITVWSAGPGRPGLVEPMGVHADHRGKGYGRAITVAGAKALQDLGASSALVCTRTANVPGIATYKAAGFEPLPDRLDLRRDA